jgi:flagellar protein FlaG
MSFEIGRITNGLPTGLPRPLEHARTFAPRAAAAADVVTVDVPASPPSYVREEVERARERAEDLASQNRELHFSKDEGTGRIVVEVRDLEGHVLRTIPPSKALEVMSGAAL